MKRIDRIILNPKFCTQEYFDYLVKIQNEREKEGHQPASIRWMTDDELKEKADILRETIEIEPH